MKALEKRAEKYNKGIKILTLGRLPKIQKYIADNLVNRNEKLLDIGMGTGNFAILCAKNGIDVIGIDYSEKMLEIARKTIESEGLTEFIKIFKMPIVELDKKFPDKTFDKITASLTFSEFYYDEQEFCLDQVYRILKDDGEFILVDEVRPKKIWKKIVYFMIRIPLLIITYIISHLTTKSLKNIESRLKRHKFLVVEEKHFLLDTLLLLRLKKL